MESDQSFENNLSNLEKIVASLENGNVPLNQALQQFKKGVSLSNNLHSELASAQKTLAHVMDNEGNEKQYARDQNGQDANNNVNLNNANQNNQVNPNNQTPNGQPNGQLNNQPSNNGMNGNGNVNFNGNSQPVNGNQPNPNMNNQ